MEIINIFSPVTKTFSTNEINEEYIKNFISYFKFFQSLKDILYIHIHNRYDLYQNLIMLIYSKIFSDSNKENIFIRRILNEEKTIDSLLNLDRYLSFFNLNFVTWKNVPNNKSKLNTEKSFNSKSDEENKLNIKLIKTPIKLFILKQFHLIFTSDCIDSEYTDISYKCILNIFKEKFNYNLEKTFDDLIEKLNIFKKENDIDEVEYKNLRGKEKIHKRKLSKFHIWEMENSCKKNFRILKKLNSIHDDYEEIDDDIGIRNSMQNFNKIKNLQSIQFKIEDFYYWLFYFAFMNIKPIADDIYKEGEELKETYLHLQKLQRKNFYYRMNNLEETILIIRLELKIKVEFLSDIINKIKNKKISVLKFYTINNEKSEGKIKLYCEQMIGKMRVTKIILQNLETSLQMIKKTFRIILDDNRQMYEKKKNQVMLYLTVLITILIPVQIVYQLFGLNITLPIEKIDSLIPFFMILLVTLTIISGQFFVLKKWDWI